MFLLNTVLSTDLAVFEVIDGGNDALVIGQFVFLLCAKELQNNCLFLRIAKLSES